MTVTVPGSLAVVRPGDPEYHLLRSTYTRVHSPEAVILPRTAQEVGAALAVVRDAGLPLAVRSGGHSLAGLSSNDGGVVVDLSGMREVSVVDRPARLVRVAAGARWSRVARTLADHGLAISSGDHGNVGVGGLATTGGIGWLVRRFGLTVDRLRSADVVLADGTITTVDAEHDPELFWGLRGAGATLAVVTAFTFEAVEISTVAVARMDIEISADRNSLVAWDAYLRSAPRELTATMMLFGTVGSVTAVYAGNVPERATRAFRPLADLGVPRSADAQLVPYRALVPVGHEHPNVGQQNSFVRNGYVDMVDERVERLVLELAARPGIMVQIRSLGGAIADVDPDATAYANRHQSAMIIGTVWGAEQLPVLDAAMAPLRPHFTGAYVSFDSDRGRAVTDLAFPQATRRRLAVLKQRVDPDGMFPAYPV